jgi:hypothetical protein
MTRKTLLLPFLMLLMSCLHRPGVHCDGDCYAGYGTKKWEDGGYKKGHWHNGKLYGQGVQFLGATTDFAGDTYIGGFNEDCYDGYGTYYGKRLGFIHKGYYKNGKPNGYGEGIFGSHSTNPGWGYKGDYKDGIKSGYGELYTGTVGSSAGIRYVGYWLNDKMEGTGTYSWSDGSKYEGHFANDYFDGKAVFTFKDGLCFQGVWHEGYNPDFLKLLEKDSKLSKDKDSVLIKYFYRKEQ